MSLSRPSMISDKLTEDDSCSGWVEKQSPNLFKRWQKRYFVLEKKLLKYFKTDQEYYLKKPPKGVINLMQIWVEPTFMDLQLKIDLKLMGSNRVFNLRFSDEKSFKEWQRKLRYSISTSFGKIKELRIDNYKDDVDAKFEFWRFLRIHENNFNQEAEVGDLILFVTKKKLKLGAKLGVAPQPDRIGIIIKLNSENNQSEIYILRAGDHLNRPLILQSWSDFRIIKRNKYEECWYRHLYCERNDEFMLKTQNFISKLNDFPFAITNPNQVIRESTKNTLGETPTIQKKQTGAEANPAAPEKRIYKPAELVAKFYKYLGFLPSKQNKHYKEHIEGLYYKPNHKFEPKDFCQLNTANLGLHQDSTFGEEHVIMFNEKDIQQKLD